MSNQIQIRDRRGGNRYFIDNALLKGGWGKKDKLGPYGIAIYNALCMFANADNQTAWPSYQTLAELTGMSRRQAILMMDKLIAYNIVNKISNYHENGQTSNIYELLRPDVWRSVPYEPQSPPSEQDAPPPVNVVHPPSEQDAPKQDPKNKTQLNNIYIDEKNSSGSDGDKPKKPKEVGPKTIIKEEFIKLTNLQLPKAKKSQGYWWSQFAELLHAANDNQDRVLYAMRCVVPYMRKNNLAITGPQSVLGMCRAVLSGQKLDGQADNGSRTTLTTEQRQVCEQLRQEQI